MISSAALLCCSLPPLPPSSSAQPSLSSPPFGREALAYNVGSSTWGFSLPLHTQRKGVNVASFAQKDADKQQQQLLKNNEAAKGRALQIILWAAESVYVVWLFLLPYAPGDPVWAIKPDTVNALVGLSLNFFFILPFANAGRLASLVTGLMMFVDVAQFFILLEIKSQRHPFGGQIAAQVSLAKRNMSIRRGNFYSFGINKINPRYLIVVGIHVLESPVLHPVSEGLFNFVIGWTLMFAPLIYTDCKRDKFRGSLDLLWGLQMFLTNTFLIPYMAIRLDENDSSHATRKLSKLGSVMTAGAPIVGLVGGGICLLSTWWAISGRGDDGFGSLEDRWDFFSRYIGSERLAYAFIWDVCLYAVFQPWLISDNLQNVQESKAGIVSILQYIPVVGLVAYLLSLNYEREF